MRLLSGPSTRCFRRQLAASFFRAPAQLATRRGYADRVNYNKEIHFDETTGDHAKYDLVTANDLESRETPPQRVKMLVRDFIEDSLYNPQYGYFPQQATIFTAAEKHLQFSSMKDSVEFQNEVAKLYSLYDVNGGEGVGKQLWHTPTELFKPWYGRAIAQCLVSEYLLKYFPYEDFIIYEIGAGNGTLASDILDYLRDEHPEVYDRTQYNIIEISGNLAKLQQEKLGAAHPCVKVTHKSIFHWDTREPAPCFFVAMEVIDNFAHDVVRYDLRTLEPYQGLVAIDEHGDFSTFYSRITDPLIASFLSLRRQLAHPPPVSRLLQMSPMLRRAYAAMPLAPNLSAPEYIPTRLLSLLQTLREHFPRHRLLLTDFSSLPDTIPGTNAPVVQTRYQNTMVPCSTLLVKQGYFDIFFPTNFQLLRDMYEHVLSQPFSSMGDPARASPMDMSSAPAIGANFFTSRHPSNRRRPLEGVVSASGLPVGEHKSSVYSHAEFLETYADLSRTTLRNGENPMIDFYKNVKFLF
ncbi:DUF185-domain-containing protein [Athelia psychrophila]|uniref:Protein arginine methyltransferase NDUFAF7 n=1 Tax=Athelia psychrophila TaxID=1759441 RepID=A0A166JN54_9AGAM|nr:DUF185-domain-containing protein [Fibularhizoctonia sp. CBS 109695]